MRPIPRTTRAVLALPAVALVILLFASATEARPPVDRRSAPGYVLDLQLTTLEGEPLDLAQFEGKVLLIVNTASNCVCTPQYAGLQALYDAYRDRGLVVIGVPSNDFMWQEPGSPDEIRRFITVEYDVSFPITTKSVVKGPGRIELYRRLTQEVADEELRGDVGWNFTKFLIGRNGRVVDRFDSATDPTSGRVVRAIERQLDKPAPRRR